MSYETVDSSELLLSADAYPGPITAFSVVGANVLGEAQARGLISFQEGELRDAIGVINEVAKQIGEDEQDSLYDKLGFLVEIHETDGFKRNFSFGIEAVFKDGEFSIWWPQ